MKTKQTLRKISHTYTANPKYGGPRNFYPCKRTEIAVDFDALKHKCVKRGWTKRNGGNSPHTADTILFENGKWIPLEFKWTALRSPSTIMYKKLAKKIVTAICNFSIVDDVNIEKFWVVYTLHNVLSLNSLYERIVKVFKSSVWYKKSAHLYDLVKKVEIRILGFDEFQKARISNLLEPDEKFQKAYL